MLRPTQTNILNKIKPSTEHYTWQSTLQKPMYWVLFIITLVSVIKKMTPTKKWYIFLQKRQGVQLDDWVLEMIPIVDVSIPLFYLTYSLIFYNLLRSSFSPLRLLRYGIAFGLFYLLRDACILLVPLEEPIGLIPLTDPFLALSNGAMVVTKDLFYSGHAGTSVLVVLSLPTLWEKRIATIGAISVISMLLVQHIHYTIDVVGGCVAAVLCWYAANWIVHKLLKEKIEYVESKVFLRGKKPLKTNLIHETI